MSSLQHDNVNDLFERRNSPDCTERRVSQRNKASCTTPLVDSNDEFAAAAANEDDPSTTTATTLARFYNSIQSDDPRSVVTGLLTLAAIGSCVGFMVTWNQTNTNVPYRTLSSCIGYTYFLDWSLSFYPQVLTNYQRQSTTGLSADFCALNVLGFACYAAYTLALFSSATIQQLYHEKYNADVTVQSNDVAFAVHALLVSSLTLAQVLWYKEGGLVSLRQTMSPVISKVIAILLSIVLVSPLLVVVTAKNGIMSWFQFTWLDYLYLLSFVKILITLIKYIPQVILNYRRKSTFGWSKISSWIVKVSSVCGSNY
jgi:cystinosin